MATKKKYQFFNGGRGLTLTRESQNEKENEVAKIDFREQDIHPHPKTERIVHDQTSARGHIIKDNSLDDIIVIKERYHHHQYQQSDHHHLTSTTSTTMVHQEEPHSYHLPPYPSASPSPSPSTSSNPSSASTPFFPSSPASAHSPLHYSPPRYSPYPHSSSPSFLSPPPSNYPSPTPSISPTSSPFQLAYIPTTPYTYTNALSHSIHQMGPSLHSLPPLPPLAPLAPLPHEMHLYHSLPGASLSTRTSIHPSYPPPQHVVSDPASFNGDPTYIDLTQSNLAMEYSRYSKETSIPSPDSPPQPGSLEVQDPEGEDTQSRRKRKQRCRLCANHDKWVEVKGHKYYCPYRQEAHDCAKCTVTRRRQFYMAEQQKITREHTQDTDDSSQHSHYLQHNSQQSRDDRRSISNDTTNHNPIVAEFPRLKEMVKETADIIKPDLLAMINKVVRHKPRH